MLGICEAGCLVDLFNQNWLFDPLFSLSLSSLYSLENVSCTAPATPHFACLSAHFTSLNQHKILPNGFLILFCSIGELYWIPTSIPEQRLLSSVTETIQLHQAYDKWTANGYNQRHSTSLSHNAFYILVTVIIWWKINKYCMNSNAMSNHSGKLAVFGLPSTNRVAKLRWSARQNLA